MSYTLPYNPFDLLTPFELDSKGIKNFYRDSNSKIYHENDLEEYGLSGFVNSGNLYHSYKGIPTPFTINWQSIDIIGGRDKVKDDITYTYSDNYSDNYHQYELFELLKIVRNENINIAPIILFDNHSYVYDKNCYEEECFLISDARPMAVYFSEPDGVDADYAYKSVSSEFINDNNNDYYEGLFDYDINNDGTIPPFIGGIPIYNDEFEELSGKTLKGTKKDDVLTGTKKSDAIYGKAGADFIKGKSKSDYLYGQSDSDIINGGGGNDFIDGGKGGDILTGGDGADIFKISEGTDTVKDFKLGTDKIAINDDDISTIEIQKYDLSPKSTLITTLNGNIIIEGVTAKKINDNYYDVIAKYINAE